MLFSIIIEPLNFFLGLEATAKLSPVSLGDIAVIVQVLFFIDLSLVC